MRSRVRISTHYDCENSVNSSFWASHCLFEEGPIPHPCEAPSRSTLVRAVGSPAGKGACCVRGLVAFQRKKAWSPACLIHKLPFSLNLRVEIPIHHKANHAARCKSFVSSKKDASPVTYGVLRDPRFGIISARDPVVTKAGRPAGQWSSAGGARVGRPGTPPG
jgi:hypothetical protein